MPAYGIQTIPHLHYLFYLVSYGVLGFWGFGVLGIGIEDWDWELGLGIDD